MLQHGQMCHKILCAYVMAHYIESEITVLQCYGIVGLSNHVVALSCLTKMIKSFVCMRFDRALQWRHNGHDGVSNLQLCLTIVYSIVYSDAIKESTKAQRHWPLFPFDDVIMETFETIKMFPFDDVIMMLILFPLQITDSNRGWVWKLKI